MRLNQIFKFILYHLLDYGNKFIENVSNEEEVAQNYLSLIDGFIDVKIQQIQ